jgi:RimJ/RimL family protein N-acetyltransferase
MNPKPLFFGKKLRLTAVDPDADAPVWSQWTHDAAFWRAFSPDPVRPLPIGPIKKKFEADAKEVKEHSLIVFHLRPLNDERLIGFARVFWIEWTHGVARIQLGLGAAEDRNQGYGTDALQLLLRYAFDELNLYRLVANLPSDNSGAQRFLERAGFQLETRRREALYRDGQRLDWLGFALLREEWQK